MSKKITADPVSSLFGKGDTTRLMQNILMGKLI